MKEPISPHHLRIGNILSYDSTICYVTTLSLDIDDEGEETIGVLPLNRAGGEIFGWNREERIYSSLNFVPLTEEWLLKFGFRVLDKEGYHNELYIIERAVFGDNRWSFRVKTSETKSVGVKYFHYVHQLQNIYFALTGLELSIQ